MVMVFVAMLAMPTVVHAGGAQDLLPDLRPNQNGFFLERPEEGGVLLRVGSISLNVGEGPFALIGRRSSTAETSMRVRQRILTDAGVKRSHPTDAVMEYTGDGHDHWHLQRFISMQLYRPKAPDTVYGLQKVGFCLIDDEFRFPDLPGASPQRHFYGQTGCGFPESLRLTPGISVGWVDIYPADFVLQWIDLPPDLPPARYRVCTMVDAEEQFLETREDNNWMWDDVYIDLSTDTVERRARGRGDCRP